VGQILEERFKRHGDSRVKLATTVSGQSLDAAICDFVRAGHLASSGCAVRHSARHVRMKQLNGSRMSRLIDTQPPAAGKLDARPQSPSFGDDR